MKRWRLLEKKRKQEVAKQYFVSFTAEEVKGDIVTRHINGSCVLTFTGDIILKELADYIENSDDRFKGRDIIFKSINKL